MPAWARGHRADPDAATRSADARRCLDAGAYSVVVGTAITHPTRITRTFVAQLDEDGSAQRVSAV